MTEIVAAERLTAATDCANDSINAGLVIAPAFHDIAASALELASDHETIEISATRLAPHGHMRATLFIRFVPDDNIKFTQGTGS